MVKPKGGRPPLRIQDADPIKGHDSQANETYQFVAVNDQGEVRGYLVVSGLGFGAYATTYTNLCA